MVTKTLELPLGNIVGNPAYETGWYQDAATGQYYYYDAVQNLWYVYVAGYLYALGYMNPAPKQVSLGPGEKLKITLSFKYRGPALTVSSRYVIGIFGALGFDERVYEQKTLPIPENLTATPITVTQDATLTLPVTGAGADWNDIYVKIWTPTWEYFFGYENALIIVGIQPEISEFKILDFVKV